MRYQAALRSDGVAFKAYGCAAQGEIDRAAKGRISAFNAPFFPVKHCASRAMLRVLKFTTTEETALAGIKTGYLPYPSILTNKDWQKKKGLIGKMKKTGIGSALDKAEAVHKKIDWAYLAVNRENPANMEELKKAIQEVKNYYAKLIVPYQKALTEVADTAEGAIKDVKKMIGGGSVVKAIEAIVKEAKTQRVTLKSFDFEADIKEVAERIERRQQLARVHMNDSLKKFVVGAKAFLSDPTPESWDKHIKQAGRSVSNSVKELEDYNRVFWKDFQKFGGFDLIAMKIDTRSPEFADITTKKVKAAVVQVKEIASFKG
ncbi:hypothetical protein [Albidovulum sp.]|uniref:hypothetical protein n=1 Tax=Albidovulum sp. TaxID=1872424 RepID=UPI001E175B10|nr:hypothetical protein [Paracoccaceae bacterium]MCC0045467.1 hypothetical protein [Defluviimonas sp.]HPE25012.1 hypothetical protein [Albidovulum sp.]MCB2122330.1 hypothetical protein [Paracoccaceae bacterium]MCB2132468.1 hypothetical protein [Paracoccaceae bacterium]